MGAEGIRLAVARTQESAQQHIEGAAQALIQSLGETMEVSRVYVFRFHDTEPVRVSQIREWVGEGIKPEIDNPEMQNASMGEMGLARWGEVLLSRGIISGPVASLPEDERPFLESQDIKSIIVVPIEFNEQVWGCVGFDDCNREREWSADDIFALRRAAALLGEVIELADKHAP